VPPFPLANKSSLEGESNVKYGKTLKQLGLVCLLALLAFLLAARYYDRPDVDLPEPEIPYAGGAPLVPSVRPVIILRGSDHEMGYQHATQLIQIFGKYYLEGAAKVKRSEKNLAMIRKSEGYIKQHTPWAIDYVNGMTAGCVDAGIPMTYIQMLAHFVSTSNSPGDDDSDCSGFAAWGSATKDGKLIAGGSGDHEIRVGSKYRYRYEVNVMLFPETGHNHVFSPPSGGAGHPGMNNKGVVYAHHGTTGYYDRYMNPQLGNSGEGVPRVFLLMHCLRFASSAEEAKDIAISIPNPGGRQGGLWADVKGNALVIENRENPTVIRRPGDHGERDFLYSTNNLFSEELKGCYQPPEGQKVIFFPHVGYLGTEGSLGSVGRNFGLWNLFHNYHGEVNLDFAKMIWRFKGPSLPYDTIDEAVADYDRSQARLWNAHVSQTGNAVVAILQPDDGDNGVLHVSHGCAVRGNDSPTYQGGVVVRLNPTYTFFELKLGANPRAVASAAKTRARFDLWNAYQELSKLDYSDARYAPLNEILAKAVTEWQKAVFYQDEAGETQGSEAIVKWGKTVRGYTGAQAYARQVHEALIAPAKRPEDLGLREWHGKWGDWADRGEN
jgi:hypothetical protein